MRLNPKLLLVVLPFLFTACKKDELTDSAKIYRQQTYNYSFNSGKTVGFPRYYLQNMDSVRALVVLDEKPDMQTLITVSLFKFPSGVAYPVGVYQVSDTTDWKYVYTADSSVFAKTMIGNGTVVTDSFRSPHSYDYLTKEYNGYFIVKDIMPDTSLHLDTFSSHVFPIIGTFAR